MPNLAEITKIYYTPADQNETLNITTQLVPAPMISLRMEIDYASESSNIVVGNRYIVDLNGNATAYRSNAPTADQKVGFPHTNIAMHIVRKILSSPGGVLHIVDGSGSYLLKGKGGTLRSLEFSDSDNHWVGYAPYTAQLEFNEIELVGETINCDSSVLNANETLSTSDMVDVNKYKLKTFSENLTINLGDELYSSIRNIGIANSLTVENSSFNITYNISANGKHHYIYDNPSIYKLLPAWEQAKNFCQDRLFRQVGRLIGNILRITSDDPCANSTMQISKFDRINDTQGIAQTLDGNYKIYNETIQCSTSESEGSFNLTYNAIVKRTSDISLSRKLGRPDTIHRINKRTDYSQGNNKLTKISLEGTIEGLIEGGLISSTSPGNYTFNLPQNGSLIVQGANVTNKYNIAKLHLDELLNDNSNDLHDSIKPLLGITFSDLGLDPVVYNDCELPETVFPEASVFNLTHNYHEGTINYNIEYSSDKSCGKNLANISIQVQKPVKVFATFPIPAAQDGQIGTILQDIGTTTAQRININIQGRSDLNMYNPNTFNTLFTFETLCHDIVLPDNFTLPDPSLYILTQKSKETNVIDGSFSISLGYILNPGCPI